MADVYVYDVEVFPNYFSVIFINYWEYHQLRAPLSKDDKLIVSEEEKIAAIDKVTHITFEISAVDDHDIRDILKLVAFINQPNYLCGFNSKSYDDNMLKFILINMYKFKSMKDACKKLYEFSKLLIETEFNVLRNINAYKSVMWYKPLFLSIDVQKIPALDKVFKSLKQTLINVKWHKIKDYHMPAINKRDIHYYNPDMPLDLLADWDRFVIKDYVADILDYNLNDVLGTCELFFVLFKHIKLRFDIATQYDIYTLCDSDSKIADRFIFKYYCEAAGIQYKQIKDLRTHRTRMHLGKLISPVVDFKTDSFNKLFNQIKNMTVSTTAEIDFNFECDGTEYTIKSGGLHSKDSPHVFKSTDKIIYRDADVKSYYPVITINNNVAPKHLDAYTFIEVCKVMVAERVEAKRIGDKVKAQSLKITINVGMFGKFGFAYGPLYDLLCTLTITINGQLELLMLIERLSMANIRTISANTDGIVVELPVEKEKQYYAICKQWERDVNLELEYTDYIRYIRRDVNNYITVKKVYHDEAKHKTTYGFDKKDNQGIYQLDIKRKGQLNQFLNTEDLKKGFNMPIIAKAIEEYFVHDIPVRDTINDETDVYNFCVTQNIGKKYDLQYHKIVNRYFTVTSIQRNCRVFVSKDGGLLFKVDKDTGDKAGILAGKTVTVFNDYFPESYRPYNIDYAYYVIEAQTKVDMIISANTKRTLKAARQRADIYHTGTLFDDVL